MNIARLLIIFIFFCFSGTMSCCSTTPSPTKKKFIQLPDADLDCPNPTCWGWLKIFAEDDGNKVPLFIRCANEECRQRTMVSRFPSTKCPICPNPILFKEIITCGTDGKWVYALCYGSSPSHSSQNVCMRCAKPIEDELSAVPVPGGVGFIHLKCSNKRKLLSLAEEQQPSSSSATGSDEDDQLTSSPAASSLSSSSTTSFFTPKKKSKNCKQ